MKKLSVLLLPLVSLFFLAGCSLIGGGESKKLTLTDVDPAFGSIGQSFVFPGYEYSQIGVPAYDDFFKSSAKLSAMAEIATKFSDETTSSLKKIARDRLARQENAGLKLSDSDIESMNAQQIGDLFDKSFAKTKEIDAKQKENYIDLTKNLILVAGSLVKSVESANQLISSGAQLSSQASSLDPLKAPGAVKGVSSSVSNLKDFVQKAPTLAQELTVLSKAVTMMSGD